MISTALLENRFVAPIERFPTLGTSATYAKHAIRDKLIEHKRNNAKHGEDLPKIRNWKWKHAK